MIVDEKKRDASIMAIYVKPKWRNRGVASELAQLALGYADARDLKVYCWVEPFGPNKDGTQLTEWGLIQQYRRHGFHIKPTNYLPIMMVRPRQSKREREQVGLYLDGSLVQIWSY